MKSCILFVDIDAFFASVEQIRNPRLRGRPVIVGGGVIASCSYEARRYGLRAGMPIHTALARCPGAIVLEGSHNIYKCFAEEVFDECRKLSPSVETYLDEAYCDLTGAERLNGGALKAGERLRAEVNRRTGLTVTVGIASNKMMAKITASRVKPDGIAAVEPGEEERALEALPVEKLPGVGYATHRALLELNINTVAELRRLSRDQLESVFGSHGRLLYERCRGRDTRPVSEREIPLSISRETTFHRATADSKEIRGMLSYLVERAARTMRSMELKCGKAKLHIRYADYIDRAAEKSFADPTGLDRDIYAMVMRLLERLHDRRVALRLVGVALGGFTCRGLNQGTLFDQETNERLARLYGCLDELRERYGHSIIISGDSAQLMDKLKRDSYGYILRTPSLTK